MEVLLSFPLFAGKHMIYTTGAFLMHGKRIWRKFELIFDVLVELSWKRNKYVHTSDDD